MQYSHLVDTYNKAQALYRKKKYRSAKRLFQRVVSDIYCSDTDCMADMQLCESSKEYLKEINQTVRGLIKYKWVKLVIFTALCLIYFGKK